MNIIECRSNAPTQVGRDLSNLTEWSFTLDGLWCRSMEGFLQSLKWEDPDYAAAIRDLSGVKAWKHGQQGNGWKTTQTLYWNGRAYARGSTEYHDLIVRAYDALYEQNQGFRDALLASGSAELTHAGNYDQRDSVLTPPEYLFNLYRLRARAYQAEL
jgi:predicted NAD-dependent protein-ADP-ribosyltransferase YbiA (DUF1768 family)